MECNPPKFPPRPLLKKYINVNTTHNCNLLSSDQTFCIREDGVFLIDFKDKYVKQVDYKFCPYCNEQFFEFEKREENKNV